MAFIAAFSYGACKWQENFTQQLCMFLSAYVHTFMCVFLLISKTPLRL